MNYQTYIAAAIIGLVSAAAAADDQNPSTSPEGTNATGQASSAPEAQLNPGMTTGERQSDAHAEGKSGEHKTGEASSARSTSATSQLDQSASQDQNSAEQSGYDQASSDQANSEDQSNAEDSAADQQANSLDEQPQLRLVVVVPEEMQDQMEDLIAFIQSEPNAEIVVVSQDDQDDSDQNQDQNNSFLFPGSEAE